MLSVYMLLILLGTTRKNPPPFFFLDVTEWNEANALGIQVLGLSKVYLGA